MCKIIITEQCSVLCSTRWMFHVALSQIAFVNYKRDGWSQPQSRGGSGDINVCPWVPRSSAPPLPNNRINQTSRTKQLDSNAASKQPQKLKHIYRYVDVDIDAIIMAIMLHVCLKSYLVRWWSRDRYSWRWRSCFQADECEWGTLDQQSRTSTHTHIQSIDWFSVISGNIIAIRACSTSNDRVSEWVSRFLTAPSAQSRLFDASTR